MCRSQVSQCVRMIRFRCVLSQYESDEPNQTVAVQRPGVSERTLRSRCQRFEDEGEACLLDRRLG